MPICGGHRRPAMWIAPVNKETPHILEIQADIGQDTKKEVYQKATSVWQNQGLLFDINRSRLPT